MDDGFKHITVTSEPDEDVVIHAGLRRDPEPVPEAAPALASESNPVPAQEPASVSAPVEEPAPVPSLTQVAEPDDELDAAPMSLTQRIVIIAVVVLLVVAVAYCVAFMR